MSCGPFESVPPPARTGTMHPRWVARYTCVVAESSRWPTTAFCYTRVAAVARTGEVAQVGERAGVQHGGVGTRSARGQHTVSTRSAHGQRTVSTRSARNQHTVSTRAARGQHTVNTRPHDQHAVRTWSTHHHHTTSTPPAHHQHAANTLRARRRRTHFAIILPPGPPGMCFVSAIKWRAARRYHQGAVCGSCLAMPHRCKLPYVAVQGGVG